MRGRSSSFALAVHAMAAIPKTQAPINSVLAFQLAGCEYHPPAGDHTCLGYLYGGQSSGVPIEGAIDVRDLASGAYSWLRWIFSGGSTHIR